MSRPTNSAPKQKSRLRTTFDPDDAHDDTVTAVVKPAARLGASVLSRAASERRDRDEVRPSYSKIHLAELRSSTPTTPKDLSSGPPSDDEVVADLNNQSLDVASKFGMTAPAVSMIPSAAEIAEKKARRARLAGEQAANVFAPSTNHNDDSGYIPLEAYDSDGEFKTQRLQVGTHLAKNIPEKDTRLTRDDEDMMEGFDDYVDDTGASRIVMSRVKQQQQDIRNREQLRELIDDAEGAGGSSNGSDQESDSDVSLRHAYESAQTSHGLDGQAFTRKAREREAKRPRQPEKTTPIPTLAAGIGRLKELLQQAELAKQKAEKRAVEIEIRRTQVQEEQRRIQLALVELGEQLHEASVNSGSYPEDVDKRPPDRGLDTIGGV